jgi:hypothetical protein
MDKVKISNTINRIGCGDELLYCTRVYVNARIYGGAWIPMEKFLDTTFWLLRGQKQHCRASYLYERRHNAKKRKLEKEKAVSKDWEQSFLPFGEGGIPPDEVACDQCGTLGSLTLDMIEVKRWTNTEPINLRFCNETCHQEWYMAFQRRNQKC